MAYRPVVAILVATLLVPIYLPAEQAPQAPAGKLSLVIVSGSDMINNIKQRTTRDTIVEVQDENHKPVAGAAVSFLLPGSGPGGTFANGAKSITLVTGSDGRVVMPRMTANAHAGSYQIHVNATYRGQQATAIVGQQNVAAAAAGAGAGVGAGISVKVVAIIAGVAAAGAVTGAVVATRSGGTPTGTVSAGTATFGPPR